VRLVSTMSLRKYSLHGRIFVNRLTLDGLASAVTSETVTSQTVMSQTASFITLLLSIGDTTSMSGDIRLLMTGLIRSVSSEQYASLSCNALLLPFNGDGIFIPASGVSVLTFLLFRTVGRCDFSIVDAVYYNYSSFYFNGLRILASEIECMWICYYY